MLVPAKQGGNSPSYSFQAMAIDNIPAHFTTEYSENWVARTQQRKSRLDPFINIIDFNGERKRFDRVGASVSRRRTERAAPTPVSNATSDSRWAYREFFEIPARILDEDDALNLAPLVLPTSQYVMDDAAMYNRDVDDLAVAIALRDAKVGQDGTGVFPLPATQKIVHGGTGLTLAKLISANEIRLAAEMDDSTPWVLVVSKQQVSNLLNTTEIKSADYNTVRALVAGQIDTFMGFRFVINNRLPKATTTRTCVAWANGAVQMIRGAMSSKIDTRKDLSYATQIYSKYNLGGVRIHDEAVISIECTEV